jgi:hypothetical protein
METLTRATYLLALCQERGMPAAGHNPGQRTRLGTHSYVAKKHKTLTLVETQRRRRGWRPSLAGFIVLPGHVIAACPRSPARGSERVYTAGRFHNLNCHIQSQSHGPTCTLHRRPRARSVHVHVASKTTCTLHPRPCARRVHNHVHSP